MQFTLVLSILSDISASAQQVVVPPPPTPEQQQVPLQPPPSDTNEISSATSSGETGGTTAPVVPHNTQPFQWGPFVAHPHLSYGFTYGNGIHVRPGEQRRTILQTVSPGIGLNIGKVWHFDYTPSFAFYSDKDFKNTVNHRLVLNGATSYESWNLGLSQSCAITSDPEVETGRQTDRQAYSTGLNASYQMNGEMSLDLGVSQNIRSVEGFSNSAGDTRDWSTMDWLNYHFAPNLSAGLGAGVGYDSMELSGDSTYELVQGRIQWRIVQKISLSVSGGADIRQFLGTDQPGMTTPIFSVSLAYQPFDHTTISLSASRTVSASTYFVNQTTENTGFNAAINQRFFGRFNFAVSGGYRNTKYVSSVPGIFSVERDDDYSFIRVSISTRFLKRGTASISYSKSKNSSNAGGFGYSSDQVGFHLAYRY